MKIYFFDRKSSKIWREATKEDLHMQTCKFLGWISEGCAVLIIAHTTQIGGHVHMHESFTKHHPEYKNIAPNIAGILHFKGYVLSWHSPGLNIQTPEEYMSPVYETLMSLLEK